RVLRLRLATSIVPYTTLFRSHQGKTAPCAQLLVANQIKKVVIAVQDPNPLVSGKGIKILEDGGAEVVVGVLEKQATALNKRFFRSEEHTSELQSRFDLVCRLL